MVVTKGLPDPPGAQAEAEARARVPNESVDEASTEAQRNGFLAFVLKVLKFVAEQWLVIGFGLACLFGYLWPGKKVPTSLRLGEENVKSEG